MRPSIALLSAPSPAKLPFEIVERKGIGHPDTICDALAENLSATLSRAYLQRFGRILHHNVDKALLVGGVARPAFGARAANSDRAGSLSRDQDRWRH